MNCRILCQADVKHVKSSKRSKEVLWWFGGWTCPVKRIRALAVARCSQQRAVREKSSRVSKTFLSVKVVPYTQGVPGSHWGIPGGLEGAPSGRSSVPTAMDGADDISRVG